MIWDKMIRGRYGSADVLRQAGALSPGYPASVPLGIYQNDFDPNDFDEKLLRFKGLRPLAKRFCRQRSPLEIRRSRGPKEGE